MRTDFGFQTIDIFGQTLADPLNFTQSSEEEFYDVVDLADFKDNDADTIFNSLKNKLRLVPFGDYLKRYIFIHSGMKGDYRDIGLKEYQHIIVDSFEENSTPKSFTETSAKLSALAKNWLTQVSVGRQTVFLLGFGLNMSLGDVSAFLTNAQREHNFNFKDATEVIYWYCFKNRYKYPKAFRLQQIYNELDSTGDGLLYGEMTIVVRDTIQSVRDDESLLSYLSRFKTDSKKLSFSVTAYKRFSDLYLKCKTIAADYYNRDEEEQLAVEIEAYKAEARSSEKLFEYEKSEHIQKMRAQRKIWAADDITDKIIEDILCCGTPSDKNGNLLKLSISTLSKHFNNKRMSRQRLNELLLKKAPVGRFDLITLNFFIFSQDTSIANNKSRYSAFIEDTNKILNDCAMGDLYIANPYECFLLMCILSDEPLATYAEVLEKSFEEREVDG